MNLAILTGRLTKEPELRQLQSGTAVCIFTLAVNRRKKVEGQPDADFFTIIAWGKLGELCDKWLVKGQEAKVAGEIRNRTYDAKDGTKRYVTEIVANEVEFGAKPGGASGNNNAQVTDGKGYEADIEPIEDEKLPF